jgi:hypothetical protein
MSLTQEVLHAELAGRVRAVRPDLAAGLDMSTMDGLLAAQAAIGSADPETGTGVVSVVREFEPAAWIRGTVAFAAGLAPAEAAAWRASFTRTFFLAGNPANLRDRFGFAHMAEGGSVAWTRPGEPAANSPLRRLLKLFDGPAPLPPWPPLEVLLPGGPPAGRTRVLYVATAGATVDRSLVHLNHLLAEAVFDGLVAPGDRLVVRQVPRLVGVTGPFAALRIGTDPANTGLLRAFAALTEEIPHD